MTPRQRWVAGVIFALGFPGFPISAFYDEFASVGHLVGYEAIWWAAIGLVLLYVRFAEHLPVTSIGLRKPSLRELGIGALAGIVILAGLVAIYNVVLPAIGLDEQQQTRQLLAMPSWWLAISVVRAAVGEELLFRGYALERLASLTGSRAVAGLVTCSVFTLEHIGFWGWGHLLIAGFGGAMLTLLYLWRRNLWVSILAHLIIDGVALFAG